MVAVGRRQAEGSDRSLFQMGFVDVCRALGVAVPDAPRLARLASEFGAGSPPDTSAISEQQVAVMLLRSLEQASPGAAVRHDTLLHYRSRTGAEIDFVSPVLPRTCVESKFVDRTWGRAFQTIEASGRRTGIVATRSGLKRHDAGWALPAGLFAFLLGR